MKWDADLYNNKHDFVAKYGEQLLEFIPDNTEKILDLGCGTGTLTSQLVKHCDYVRGVDGSEQMIQKAKANFPEIDFEVVDALKLPYEHEWDVVFSNSVFHWIFNHDLLLGNIHRALCPNGMLICEFGAERSVQVVENGFAEILTRKGYSYHTKFNFTSAKEFKKLLQKNGFSIIEVYEFDRPTHLKDGRKGLRNWMTQFYEKELEEFSSDEQKEILDFVENASEELWTGTEWVADYRRLRAIARA